MGDISEEMVPLKLLNTACKQCRERAIVDPSNHTCNNMLSLSAHDDV